MQFRFLTVYCNMVKRLLEFIEASRTRNWLQHLFSAEGLMQDFISMDRCKYRKCWMVYIVDMKNLEYGSTFCKETSVSKRVQSLAQQ